VAYSPQSDKRSSRIIIDICYPRIYCLPAFHTVSALHLPTLHPTNRKETSMRVILSLAISICVAFVVMLTSPSGKKANAATDTECGTQYDTCANNCSFTSTSCVYNCETSYGECVVNSVYPAPSPVFDRSRSECLETYYGYCNTLPLEERFACKMEYWEYCRETYPRPGFY
jgi:hypothetical protein